MFSFVKKKPEGRTLLTQEQGSEERKEVTAERQGPNSTMVSRRSMPRGPYFWDLTSYCSPSPLLRPTLAVPQTCQLCFSLENPALPVLSLSPPPAAPVSGLSADLLRGSLHAFAQTPTLPVRCPLISLFTTAHPPTAQHALVPQLGFMLVHCMYYHSAYRFHLVSLFIV